MARVVYVCPDQPTAVAWVAKFIIAWCSEHPLQGLGGATGRTFINVWEWIWAHLDDAGVRERLVQEDIVFLDEYFGAYPSYYHWAWRNLRVGCGGFHPDHVKLPRGIFYELGQIVSSHRLDAILRETTGEWEARTEPGEDGNPPEVWIRLDASHPVLQEIRHALDYYESVVQLHCNRLQLLGIGVGGAIAVNPQAGGHIGFVECGAAAGGTSTMLVRTAPSTQEANRPDFELTGADGPVTLEPARYAVTQGISSILSAGALLLAAWGAGKCAAVQRMLLGTPGPLNPAAWVQTHSHVTVVIDAAAYGCRDAAELRERGWEVEFVPRS